MILYWRKMFFLAPLALTLTSLWSYAADSLQLHEAIEESLQSNLGVQKSKSAVEESAWRRREHYIGVLPSLSAGLNYITDQRYMVVDLPMNGTTITTPQIAPTMNATITASWLLYDGSSNWLKLDAASSLENAARKELRWQEFWVSRQTILAFYRILASESLKTVAEQNLKILNDHLKDAEALKRSGASTSYDLLRVQVQVSESNTEILQTQDNLEMARLKLAEWLGKSQEDRIVKGVFPNLEFSLIQNLQAFSPESRLDLEAQQERLSSSKQYDRSLARYWVPKLSAFGQFQHFNNINTHVMDKDVYRDAYAVGLNLNWNIFDGMSSIAKSAQATEQALQAEKSLQQAKIRAEQDFEYWRRKYIYFISVFQARSSDVTRSLEAVRLAQEGRKAGTRTTTELLDAELDLFRAKAGAVNAQFGTVEALVNLELATGQELYEFK